MADGNATNKEASSRIAPIKAKRNAVTLKSDDVARLKTNDNCAVTSFASLFALLLAVAVYVARSETLV